MSFKEIGFTKVLLAILAILMLFLVISSVYLTEVLIPRKIQGLVEHFSQDKGYKIEVKEIDVDFFSGLKGREIEVSDPVTLIKPLLKVGEVVIRPEILASILNWKVTVGTIIIHEPVFSLTEDDLNNLLRLFGQLDDDDDEEEKEKKPLVEVRRIAIRDARIEVLPGVFLNSKTMDVVFEDSDTEEQKALRLSGSMNLKGEEMKVKGKINPFLDKPTAEFGINIAQLDIGRFSGNSRVPNKLAIQSDLRIQVSDDITSQGTVNVVPAEGAARKDSPFFGKLDYELSYDKATDTILFHSLGLDINELTTLAFTGSIEKIRKGAVINLSGDAKDVQLSRIHKWVPSLADFEFTGHAKARDITISGHIPEKNIAVAGDVLLRDVGIGGELRDMKIERLNGTLRAENTFRDGEKGAFSAEGRFSFDNASMKLGELKNGSGGLAFISENDWERKKLNFHSLNASFLGGSVSGDVELEFLGEKENLGGKVRGTGLDLNKIPHDLIPIGLTGVLEDISATFIGEDMDHIDAAVRLSAVDLRLETADQNTVKASRIKAKHPLKIKFVNEVMNEGTSDERFSETEYENKKNRSTSKQSRIAIEGEGLSYEKLSYNDFLVKEGGITSLRLDLYENSKWVLTASSNGSHFEVKSKDVHLDEFRLDIGIERNEELVISGNLRGEEGKYANISVPSLSTDFNFKERLLRLSEVRAEVGNHGHLQDGEFDLTFGEGEDGSLYKIALVKGNFSGFDQKVVAKDMAGEFMIDAGPGKKPEWHGGLFIPQADVYSHPLTDFSTRVVSSPEGINVEKISGSFAGGELNGNIFIGTSDSSRLISSHIELDNAVIPLSDFQLPLGELALTFRGDMGSSAFPVGHGEIRFSNLAIGKDGSASSLRGEMQIETSAETISIKDGFIENGEGEKISLTAGLENSSGNDKRIWVDMPEAPLTFFKNALSPLLPQAMKEIEYDGKISLWVAFNPFLDGTSSFQGELSIDHVSFGGRLNETDLLIRDVSGVLSVKDTGTAGVSLPSLIRDYKEPGDERLLDERLFKGFLDALKNDGSKNEESFLRVKEIAYGFLRFQDIECELELSKRMINLKRLESRLYEGRAYGSGRYDFGAREDKYQLSLLFSKISLASISSSIPSAKDYISGKTNGLIWLRGEGKKPQTLDGLFYFWTIESKDEPRRIGKALLQKLGVRERLLLRESRKYNKGEISGYIKDGVMTFRELEISHSMLVFRDLSIEVDEKRNSISVAHLLSVIRETAKRASEGELQIEFQK